MLKRQWAGTEGQHEEGGAPLGPPVGGAAVHIAFRYCAQLARRGGAHCAQLRWPFSLTHLMHALILGHFLFGVGRQSACLSSPLLISPFFRMVDVVGAALMAGSISHSVQPVQTLWVLASTYRVEGGICWAEIGQFTALSAVFPVAAAVAEQ